MNEAAELLSCSDADFRIRKVVTQLRNLSWSDDEPGLRHCLAVLVDSVGELRAAHTAIVAVLASRDAPDR